MNIVTAGRTDVHDFFKLSGIRETKKLTHTPFLVFLESHDQVEVRLVDSANKLLEYSDETPVMAQWSGQWKSDFFRFTVGDFRKHVVAHPPQKHYVV